MKRITNIKTSKTEKLKQDFLVSLKARKRHHLQNTDWTQLNDVSIENADEVLGWRRELRDFEIGDEPDLQTERTLTNLIDSKPDIIYSSNISIDKSFDFSSEEDDKLKLIQDYSIELPEDSEDDFVYLELSDAKQKLKECFNEYKADELIKKGCVVEYNLKKIMLEEAVDRKLSNGNSSTPLLDQDSTSHTEQELDEIINGCRDYFKNINQLYTRLNKEERSLYNMDSNEIDEWFESHGYRYRCKD